MITPSEINRLKEAVDVLTGARQRGSAKQAALRVADLDALLQLPARLESRTVSGSVTVDDFHALRADVLLISQALASVGAALQARAKA